MNNDNIKKWTTALRSGEYEQGPGKLGVVTEHGKTMFCCLGVACLIGGVEHVIFNDFEDDDLDEAIPEGEMPKTYFFNGSEELPPADFFEWVGLPDPEMRANEDVQIDVPLYITERNGLSLRLGASCANLNDGGMSFAQIADMIDYFGLAEEF